MTLFVDTSVWSLAFRRDAPPNVPQVEVLARSLAGTDDVVTAGIVVLELFFTRVLRPIGVALGRREKMLDIAQQVYSRQFTW